MQESTLAALHQDLESKHQARGGSGGLGFNAADAKASKKAEKKGNKRVRGADDGRRDFSSTSSGAVAAGHWDPWARPVEFKMRTKNTTVGGLYSMFVRGDTMGGTLKDAQAATPASGAEGDSHGKQKRAKAARQDKTKKRRPRENGGGADNASAACVKSDKASKGEAGGQGPTDRAAAVAAQAGNGAPASFDWEADILRRLHEVTATLLDWLSLTPPLGAFLLSLPVSLPLAHSSSLSLASTRPPRPPLFFPWPCFRFLPLAPAIPPSPGQRLSRPLRPGSLEAFLCRPVASHVAWEMNPEVSACLSAPPTHPLHHSPLPHSPRCLTPPCLTPRLPGLARSPPRAK